MSIKCLIYITTGKILFFKGTNFLYSNLYPFKIYRNLGPNRIGYTFILVLDEKLTNGVTFIQRMTKKKETKDIINNNAVPFLYEHGIFIYNMACLGLTLYFGYDQFKRYFENKDVSSFVTKEINNSPRGSYPSYTICLEGQESETSGKKGVGVDMYDRAYLKNEVNFDQIRRPWKCKKWKWTKDVGYQYGNVFNHNPEACIYRGFLESKKDVWEKVSSQDLQQNISKIDFD